MLVEQHQYAGTRFQTVEKILKAGYGSGGGFTDIIQIGLDGDTYRPSTNFHAAVYSLSPNPKVIGLSNLQFSWDIMLNNTLPDDVFRVDCVLSTATTTATIAIDQGKVTIVGRGDFHDAAMTPYGQAIVLDVTINNPLSASDYTITIFPSTALYNQYVTQLPLNLGVGTAVAVFCLLNALYLARRYNDLREKRLRLEKERLHQSQANAKKAAMDR